MGIRWHAKTTRIFEVENEMNIREKIILKLLPELKTGVEVTGDMLDDIVKAADYLVSKMENKPEFTYDPIGRNKLSQEPRLTPLIPPMENP